MKDMIKPAKLFIALAGVMVFLFSCKKQELYRDADYPGQVIYLPAAVNGIFVINSVPQRIGDVPTPGMAYRFTIDAPNNKFVVPLGVFRSGIDNKGAAKVKIAVNTDTVSNLIAGGKFTGNLAGAELLPAGNYTIQPEVELKDGSELATFELKVDLGFLLANKGKIYALGVSIASDDIKPNLKLKTAVVVIDTKLLIPTAAFSSKIDAADNRKVNFTNTSVNGVSYSWNFGDNTAISTEKNPSHTFTTYGNQTITLTTKGVSGETSVVTNVITL